MWGLRNREATRRANAIRGRRPDRGRMPDIPGLRGIPGLHDMRGIHAALDTAGIGEKRGVRDIRETDIPIPGTRPDMDAGEADTSAPTNGGAGTNGGQAL